MEQKRVLIIDDEVDLCHLLKSYFVRKKYNVEISHSLTEGLSKVESFHPEILFLDNNLPDGLGWESIPAILEKAPLARINLISAYNPPVPPLPTNVNISVYEKPISFSQLDSGAF